MSYDNINLRTEPCDGCANRQLCQDRRIACTLFWGYVNNTNGRAGTPLTREPNKETYWMVFPTERPRQQVII
jgi:hypothetical protein